MAIAITEPVAENVVTTNATSYSLGAFTPTANSLLVIGASLSGTLATLVISGGGLVWNHIITFIQTDIFTIAWAQVGGSPASTTITATADTTATGGGVCAFQVTGHDITGITPIKQATKKSSTGSQINANILFDQAMDTNNGYIALWSGGLGGTSSTPPTGWTETVDAAYTVPARNFAAAFRATGETASTVTFTNATTNWTCVGLEVFVAGASPLRKGLASLGCG